MFKADISQSGCNILPTIKRLHGGSWLVDDK